MSAALPLDPYKADCARCQGLCCVAPGHRAGDGFPRPKPGDRACENLDRRTFRCRIFERLEAEGFTVCRGYECFGAGPQVVRWLGDDWQERPAEEAAARFDDFRRLSRLRCLVAYMERRADLADHPLYLALAGIVVEYDRSGRLPPAQAIGARLAAYPDLTREALRAVGYTGSG
ncbi:MAG: hypothetical protein RLO01_06405 [Thalassobaculaceae bacterium]